MRNYVFKGGPAEGLNLGRFGWVKPGAVLTLTPREAMTILGDERFQEYDPLTHENVTPPNDPKAEQDAFVESLRQMSLEELRGVAKEHGITYHPRTSAAKLLGLILAKVPAKNGSQGITEHAETED